MKTNDFNISQNESKLKNYKIIKVIGFGASGTVYQVQKRTNNDKDKRILILKQIPIRTTDINLEETSELLKQAKNESFILSHLNYKYIVKYHESFIEDDYLNIIMDYYEKGDLYILINNLIQKNEYLQEDKIWNFFIQLSLGLEFIHQKKIIHRDLKPMNIFLSKNNIIKIGDLGFAKILKNQTKSNTFFGTPYYMSPEVCEGKPYNSKNDVWALGCILYELCSLKKPFNAFNQAALGMKIIEGKYIPLNKLKGVPSYCKNFEYFTNMMLEKDCDKRPFMKDILKNKIFYEKAKELGYEQDIKFVLNNYSKVNDYNINSKKRMTPSCYKKRKKFEIRRLNSSSICANKKSIKKIPRLLSSKASNKKLRRTYQILQSFDNNIMISNDKSTIEKGFKKNIKNSRNNSIYYSAKNILTTVNNSQKNKRKLSIPNINLKKILINKILNTKACQNKLNSKYNQYIKLTNNNSDKNNNVLIAKKSKEKQTHEINKEKGNTNIINNNIEKEINNLGKGKLRIKGIKIINVDKTFSTNDKSSSNVKRNKDKINKLIKINKNIQKNILHEQNKVNLSKYMKLNKNNNIINYISSYKDKESYTNDIIINDTYVEFQKYSEEVLMTQNTSSNLNENFDYISDKEDYDEEEKVSIFKEQDKILLQKEKIKKQKEEYIKKYNEYKEEIIKYKKFIDINKLFELYDLISKNKDKIEDISKKIEVYLKSNLADDNYKKLKSLFKKFILYDINITNINRFK